MKTTFELPDHLFKEAKSTAASLGQSLRQFLTDALIAKLTSLKKEANPRPWMKHFGALKEKAQELRRIDGIIDEEFENTNPGDWE